MQGLGTLRICAVIHHFNSPLRLQRGFLRSGAAMLTCFPRKMPKSSLQPVTCRPLPTSDANNDAFVSRICNTYTKFSRFSEKLTCLWPFLGTNFSQIGR